MCLISQNIRYIDWYSLCLLEHLFQFRINVAWNNIKINIICYNICDLCFDNSLTAYNNVSLILWRTNEAKNTKIQVSVIDG